jgi:hypothetical protein
MADPVDCATQSPPTTTAEGQT